MITTTLLALALAGSPAAGDCDTSETDVCFVTDADGDPLDGRMWVNYGTADWADGYQVVNRSDGTQLWVVVSDFTGTFGADAGDRIDVRLVGSDGIEQVKHQQRADDMGCARLVWTEAYTGGDPAHGAGEFVAEDCDY